MTLCPPPHKAVQFRRAMSHIDQCACNPLFDVQVSANNFKYYFGYIHSLTVICFIVTHVPVSLLLVANRAHYYNYLLLMYSIIHYTANEGIQYPANEGIQYPANEGIQYPANEGIQYPANEVSSAAVNPPV